MKMLKVEKEKKDEAVQNNTTRVTSLDTINEPTFKRSSAKSTGRGGTKRIRYAIT
eukprot:CAMPEP_0178974072 /NCGR_PEP_ID=MMETSP0789-20121207/22198_1 /TAXON_ID=3005 /ORGANISM="Rhizosolenia setigera, Strain CCMP 1694" /LENGTH=54 /DNA_ID=CAMNT_0020662255 /DNA_START=8 /DNA_END=169 /DNA_ORIENTATION=+